MTSDLATGDYLHDVEASSDRKRCRLIRALYILHLCVCRTLSEQLFQFRHCCLGPAHHHFDSPVREIPGIAAQPKRPGVTSNEPAEANSLHHARNQKHRGHAGRLRVRTASNTIGVTETAMIASMTRVKFSRTILMLPKKYPPRTNSPTQRTAPITLKVRNFG